VRLSLKRRQASGLPASLTLWVTLAATLRVNQCKSNNASYDLHSSSVSLLQRGHSAVHYLPSTKSELGAIYADLDCNADL